MGIQFVIESWESAAHDEPYICETSGALRIAAGTHALTRNEDGWSKTVKSTTRLSAYPLALWLAASWWRLRWEPLPSGRAASTSWRLAHEISSSGHGFLWPRIALACDGANMQVWTVPTSPDSDQPVHYLADRHDVVSVNEFVESVDAFVELVLERLEAVGCYETELESLWEEVREERKSGEDAEFRSIEAMLGFDPDDLAADVVTKFIELGNSIGSGALREIASACSSPDPETQLERISHVAETTGVQARFDLPTIDAGEKDALNQPPWIRGQRLARTVRDATGLDDEAINDNKLLALAQITDRELFDGFKIANRFPVGLGVRKNENDVKIVLRRKNREGRRFEFARLLCDHLVSCKSDKWLPATDTKTIRQKWQRSFAAEFLCPIDSIINRIEDDFSEDSIDEAAKHFGVSERTISSQLVNHRLFPQFTLEEQSRSVTFPYLI